MYFYIQRSESITHSEMPIKRIDVVWAFLDRFLLFKELGLKSESKIVLKQAYAILLQCINKINVHENKEKFVDAKKEVSKMLGFNLRIVKLNLIYWKKYLHESLAFSKFKILFNYRLLLSNRSSRVFIVATPTHGNLGDQAIVLSEKQMLNKCGYEKKQIIEIRDPDFRRYGEYIKQSVNEEDLIVIDGGGNLGTLWPREDDKITNIINMFEKNDIVIFPQTCFYDDTLESRNRLQKNIIAYKRNNLSIFLRDKRSYEFCVENFKECNVHFCPDIVLSLDTNIHKDFKFGANVLLCFRNDLEKVSDVVKNVETKLDNLKLDYKHTSTLVNKKVTSSNRKKEVKNKLREFCNANLVITDRLHAMIFSALVGTPCIALDNISKKVSGVYFWINKLEYIKCILNADEIEDNLIKELVSKNNNKFEINNECFGELEAVLVKKKKNNGRKND